ncbi:DUF106 domain-containing protein [Candidatus Micrarchaeota archaeon]|nr:DUF106 domain-containing protein [Candidatus Micrarchaeota archaeon]
MITTENYFWIVTILALVYTVVIRIIQMKLINQDKTKELQKRMNDLNKDYLSAMKSNNKSRMDSIQKEQNELMPKFNKLMMGQLKVMGVVIVVFLAFMYPVNTLDPFMVDDQTFDLVSLSSAQGEWCGSFAVQCSSSGPWLVDVTAYSGTSEKGTNSTYIYCSRETGILPSPVMKGTLFPITTDKKVYTQNENATVCITAPEGTDRAVGKTDSGTWFMVPLPFTIPVLNANAINGANIWFIVVSIIFGLIFSFVWGKVQKKKPKGEAK